MVDILEANLKEFEALKLGMKKYLTILDSHGMDAIRQLLEFYSSQSEGFLTLETDFLNFNVRTTADLNFNDSVVPRSPEEENQRFNASKQANLPKSPIAITKSKKSKYDREATLNVSVLEPCRKSVLASDIKKAKRMSKKPPKTDWPKKSKRVLK